MVRVENEAQERVLTFTVEHPDNSGRNGGAGLWMDAGGVPIAVGTKGRPDRARGVVWCSDSSIRRVTSPSANNSWARGDMLLDVQSKTLNYYYVQASATRYVRSAIGRVIDQPVPSISCSSRAH